MIYPGFGWANLKGKDAADATIPRLGGEFFWRQFVDIFVERIAWIGAILNSVETGKQHG